MYTIAHSPWGRERGAPGCSPYWADVSPSLGMVGPHHGLRRDYLCPWLYSIHTCCVGGLHSEWLIVGASV